MTTTEMWDQHFETWEGDKALYWAGCMASASKRLLQSNIFLLSEKAGQLRYAMERYDEEIIKRMEERK
jgi:hypothetical protein